MTGKGLPMPTPADLQELERHLLALPPDFHRERALERVRDLMAEQECRLWWPPGHYPVRAPRPGER